MQQEFFAGTAIMPGVYSTALAQRLGQVYELGWTNPIGEDDDEEDDLVRDYAVIKAVEGTADISFTLAAPAHKIFIVNDAPEGGASLTFTINSITITVQPQEYASQVFVAFQNVAISSAVPFRCQILQAVLVA
jgi:hypothetical protein